MKKTIPVIFYLIWIIFFLRSTYKDLTPQKDIFQAKSNYLKGIDIYISNLLPAKSKTAYVTINDTSNNKAIVKKKVVLKSLEMLKVAFPKVPDSKGKNYICNVVIDGVSYVPTKTNSLYHLTVFEALPFLLYNTVFHKPFPLNQGWIHSAFLLIYLTGTIILSSCIFISFNPKRS